MQEESYDVVIIGAGPAGLRCAEVLGNSSLKVLLIEKKAIIGPKICAGGLTLLDYEFVDPIEKKLQYRLQHIILNGKEYVINLKNPLYTIDRKDLGQYQLSLLKKYSNLVIRTSCELKATEKDCVIVKTADGDIKISYRYLVGSDGSASMVRKYLGLKSKLYMGIQYIIPKTSDKLVWILEPKSIGSAYGWIFPHKEFTSAGLFYNPKKMNAAQAKEKLDAILDKQGIDYTDARFEGAPTNCLYKGIKFGNVFLVGDAAGLVSANTGEGIAYALASGEDVAECILTGTKNFKKIRHAIKYKRRQEMILRLFDMMPLIIQNLMFHIFIYLLGKSWFESYYGD